MGRPVSLVALSLLAACARGPEPEPRAPTPDPAPAASATPAPPPPEDRRCADAPRQAADNLNVVVEDPDGELPSALARVPADAAGQWADVLRRLSRECAGSEVEHALPSTRVVLRTPSECKAGARQNELVFDFVPAGSGSSASARGDVLAQGRALRVDARVTPAADGKALCAAGRVDVGAQQAEASPKRPEGAPPGQRWLAVPFQLVGGVLGLLPLRR